MYKILSQHPLVKNLIIVHAHLPGADWESTLPHIHRTVKHPIHVVQAPKTLRDIIIERQMFPSPLYRLCTSALKTQPIYKFIRNYCNDNNFSLVFNCTGIRAQESPKRAHKRTLKLNTKLTNKKRLGYDFMPIHNLTFEEVLNTYGETISSLSQRRTIYRNGDHRLALKDWPFSIVYVQGMTRHSCKICIMASKKDLRTSSQIDPEYTQEIIELESQIGHSFGYENGHQVSLKDIISLNSQTQLFRKTA